MDVQEFQIKMAVNEFQLRLLNQLHMMGFDKVFILKSILDFDKSHSLASCLTFAASEPQA